MPRGEHAASAPGVVKVRLSGSAADVGLMVRLFGTLAAKGGFMEVLEQSSPYPNRRDPGERVYLTVLLYADRALAEADQAPGGT
jgi:hypothetical protein